MIKNLLLTFCLFCYSGWSTLHAQPANDDCAEAIAIMMDQEVIFNNTDATTDGPFHPISPCPTGNNDSIFSDIWYSFTAPTTANLFLDLCGGNTPFDTRIAIYMPGTSCPPADDDLLYCNEDGPELDCPNAESQLAFQAVMGETYLIRIGGFGENSPGAQGAGTFIVSPFTSPDNDFCNDASPISFGTGIMVSNVNATTDGPSHPNNSECFAFGDLGIQADIWYTFTAANDAYVEWSTCNMVGFDSRMAVYENASCPVKDTDLHGCNDDGSGCMAFTSKLGFEVTAGNTYLLRIGGYDGERGQGSMDLIETLPPERPVNDLCENASPAFIVTPAQAAIFEGTFEGTTVDATYNVDSFLMHSCGTYNPGGAFSDVYWKFNNEGLDSIELYFSRDLEEGEFYIDLLSDCLTPVDTNVIRGSCFRMIEDQEPTTNTITGLPTTPTDFYVRVTTRLTTDLPGLFFFQLIGELPPPNATQAPELSLAYDLFPNPAHDQIQLQLELEENMRAEFRILNLLGEMVQAPVQENLQAGTAQLEFDLQHLSNGIYFLSIATAQGQKSIRFIKN